MKKTILLLLCTAVLSQAAIPSTVGWHELPNTKLHAVAPPANFGGTTYNFSFASYSVTEAWSGGMFDTPRNRMLIWGGGHGDYGGNEVYALDLNTEKMVRLTDPATPIADLTASPAIEELNPFNGTQPNGRHTYDGLCTMPNNGLIWAFGGSLSSGNGGGSNWTWIFDPATLIWKHVIPTGDNPGVNSMLGVVSDYDSVTGDIYMNQRNGFYKYHYTASGGTYTKITEAFPQLNFSMTGLIDAKRRKFLMIGNGDQHVFDLNNNGAFQNFGSTGAASLINHQGPGLAYDPVTDRIIGWANGDTVYSLNVDTKVWTPHVYPGGPWGSSRGTYGRFQYVPALDAFVTYNTHVAEGYSAADANGYVLRTRPATTVESTPRPGSGREGQTTISPNPFTTSTVLQFSGAVPAKVSVFDLRGRQVAQLGVHEGRAVFEGKDAQGRALTQGVYTALFRTDKEVRSARLFLVK